MVQYRVYRTENLVRQNLLPLLYQNFRYTEFGIPKNFGTVRYITKKSSLKRENKIKINVGIGQCKQNQRSRIYVDMEKPKLAQQILSKQNHYNLRTCIFNKTFKREAISNKLKKSGHLKGKLKCSHFNITKQIK